MYSSKIKIDKPTNPVRLLYVIYGENLLYSGILRSQVRKMLLKLYRIGNSDVKLMGDSNSKVEQIRLLSFVNPVSLVRERKKWKVESRS